MMHTEAEAWYDDTDPANLGWAYRYVNERGVETSGALSATDPEAAPLDIAAEVAEAFAPSVVRVYVHERLKLVYRSPDDWRYC